jgi:hypothetical protein
VVYLGRVYREASLPAAAEVVVVGSDDDGLVLKNGIAAFENADDIVAFGLFFLEINL